MKSLTTLVNSENGEGVVYYFCYCSSAENIFFFLIYNYIGTQTHI